MNLRAAGPGWLFCPADRPERFAKAAAAADVVILDLEDGVAKRTSPPPARHCGRRRWTPSAPWCGSTRPDTDELAARPGCPGRYRVHDGDAVQDRIGRAGDRTRAARRHRADRDPARCGVRHRDRRRRGHRRDDVGCRGSGRHPRRQLQPAGRRHLPGCRPPRTVDGPACRVRVRPDRLDAVHLDIRDIEGLQAEADDAVAVGFDATVCIHPTQIPVVREAYRPSEEKLDWARRVLAAAKTERGVFAFEGQMVDSPVLKHAEMMLRRAGEAVSG